MPPKGKQDRWPSNSELALEQLQKDQAEAIKAQESGTPNVSQPSDRYAVEDNDLDGYVAVGPEYMTYSDERNAPLTPDKDTAETRVEEAIAASYAVGKSPIQSPGQTLGGGSNAETVHTVTSGDGTQPEVIEDRGEVYAEEGADAKNAPAGPPTTTATEDDKDAEGDGAQAPTPPATPSAGSGS